MKKAAKDTMIRTTIYLPKKVHRAMKVIAAKTGTSMADLLRESVVRTYKDDLEDLRAAEDGWRAHLKNPKGALTIEEYLAKRR